MKEVFSLVSLAGRITGKVSDTSMANHFLLRFMVPHQAHSVQARTWSPLFIVYVTLSYSALIQIFDSIN